MIYYLIYNCRSCSACYFNVGELKSQLLASCCYTVTVCAV